MSHFDDLTSNAIKQFMERDTTRDWAEAISIAIMWLKNKDGKLLGVRLSKDDIEHMEFCVQIAKQLRGEK